MLYLVRRGDADPLLATLPPGADTTVVLIEDAVTLREVPAAKVYALGDDAARRRVTPSVPTITYPELVDLVFASDRVVTL